MEILLRISDAPRDSAKALTVGPALLRARPPTSPSADLDRGPKDSMTLVDRSTKRLGPAPGENALLYRLRHSSVRGAATGGVVGVLRNVSLSRMHRGFTLLEALMASGILLTIVISVSSAISAGQQHAYEAHVKIVGTLAADELVGRIISGSYATMPTWNGFVESVGEMTNMADEPMPDSFLMVGRQAQVTSSLITLNDLGVRVRGYNVVVQSFDRNGRILAKVTRFVVEPQT